MVTVQAASVSKPAAIGIKYDYFTDQGFAFSAQLADKSMPSHHPLPTITPTIHLSGCLVQPIQLATADHKHSKRLSTSLGQGADLLAFLLGNLPIPTTTPTHDILAACP